MYLPVKTAERLALSSRLSAGGQARRLVEATSAERGWPGAWAGRSICRKACLEHLPKGISLPL